jgi:ABC-2 type transport system permease protein
MLAWYFALKDLRITLRDKSGLIFLFITPIFVITIASFALSGLFNSTSDSFTIPVVQLDRGEMGVQFVEELAKIKEIHMETEYEDQGRMLPMTESQARALLKKRKAAIIIPRDFTDQIQQRRPAEVIVLQDPGDRLLPNVVANISQRIIDKFNMTNISINVTVDTVDDVVKRAKNRDGVHLDPRPSLNQAGAVIDHLVDNLPIKVDAHEVGQQAERKVTPFESNVPGYAVMFVLFGTTFAAGSLLTEKEEGTIKRLMAMPISKSVILYGKMISNFLQAFVQTIVLFAVGHLVFQMWLGKDLLALLILIIVTCFAATGLGMLLASCCKTRAQVSGVGLLIVLSMSALGGSWWPLYITPEWMQKMAHITLTAWAMDGFNSLLIYGETGKELILPLLVLTGMGILFLAIALKRFRLE